jgi:tetratricopeptide (TPR) repeat protein
MGPSPWVPNCFSTSGGVSIRVVMCRRSARGKRYGVIIRVMSTWINSSGRVALLPASATPWREADVLFAQAVALSESGRHMRCAELLIKALSVDADHTSALHLAGITARRLGKAAMALQLLTTAHQLAPRDPRIANDLGLVLSDHGRLVDALDTFDATLAVAPQSTAVLVNRAAVLARMHRYSESVSAYQKLEKQGTPNVAVLANLAAVLEADAQFDAAARAVAKGLKLSDNTVELSLAAARLERRAGQNTKAVKRIRRCLGEDLQTPIATALQMELGRNLDLVEDHKGALVAFRRGQRLNARHVREKIANDVADTHFVNAVARIEPVLQSEQAVTPERKAAPAIITGCPGAGVVDLAALLRQRAKAVVMDELSPMAHLDGAWPPSRPDNIVLEALRAKYLKLSAQHVRMKGARHIVDCSPAHLLRLDRILHLFPRARFVVVVRHPADLLIANYIQAHAPSVISARLTRASAVVQTIEALDRLGHALVKRMGSRLYRVRYEDLVREPEITVDAVLEFLRVPSSDARHPLKTDWREGLPPGRWVNYWSWLAPRKTAIERLASASGYAFTAPDSRN